MAQKSLNLSDLFDSNGLSLDSKEYYYSLFDDSLKLFEFIAQYLLTKTSADCELVDKVHSVVDSYHSLLLSLKS